MEAFWNLRTDSVMSSFFATLDAAVDAYQATNDAN